MYLIHFTACGLESLVGALVCINGLKDQRKGAASGYNYTYVYMYMYIIAP